MNPFLRVICIAVLLCILSSTGYAQTFNVYFGTLHAHSQYSDGRGTPSDVFRWARDVARYDFFALTDHGELLTRSEWNNMGTAANSFNKDGSFVAFRGFEWSSNSLGHAVVLNTVSYTNMFASSSLSRFYSWLDRNNGLGIFAHPGDTGNTYNSFSFSKNVEDNMIGTETGNSGSGNASLSFYSEYIAALDKGWKVAPVFGQDHHRLAIQNGGRTAIIATALTRTAILEGLKARRVYSTDDPDMRITFMLNGAWMGSAVTVQTGVPVKFFVHVVDDEPITKLELVSNGGIVLDEWEIAGGSTDVTWEPSVSLLNQKYVFLRVTAIDENDDMPGYAENIAVTAPIWFTYY